MKNKKKIVGLSTLIIGLFLILGISYAITTRTLFGNRRYTIVSDGLKLYLDESKNVSQEILGTSVIPTTDANGMTTTPYVFTLVNDSDQDIDYVVYIDETNENTVPLENIRYNITMQEELLNETGNIIDLGTVQNRILYQSVIPAHAKHNFELKVWLGIDAGNETQGKKYSGKIRIEANQGLPEKYKEDILNGTDPVLSNNLVPVRIEDDGVVRKASLYDQWYSYEDRIWANAVVLEEKTEYHAGEIIPEDNIESYFVWIPKYSYKLWDLGEYTSATETIDGRKAHMIPIKFGLNNTKDEVSGECTTPKISGASGNCEVGDYMTHPAFLAFDSTGFWVGKYETGRKDATNTDQAQIDSAAKADIEQLVIKPDIYSWRYIKLGNMFKVGYEYLRDDDSHMMKNTEWGAVTYLQLSLYGSGGKVRVNNNNSLKTGYAAVEDPIESSDTTTSIEGNLLGTNDSTITAKYNTKIGYLASTTGNISGIYDMAGGAGEYVMALNMEFSPPESASEITTNYPTFFTDSTFEKYYDKYTSITTGYNYNSRILGDATGELGPFSPYKGHAISSWYNDIAYFVNQKNSWVWRGGSYFQGTLSGITAFGPDSGRKMGNVGFRIVLTIKEE